MDKDDYNNNIGDVIDWHTPNDEHKILCEFDNHYDYCHYEEEEKYMVKPDSDGSNSNGVPNSIECTTNQNTGNSKIEEARDMMSSMYNNFTSFMRKSFRQSTCYTNNSEDIEDEASYSCFSEAAFEQAVSTLLHESYTCPPPLDGMGDSSLLGSLKKEEEVSVINHCGQLEAWDCGVACITMILRWIREPLDPIDLQRKCFGLSESLSKEELIERKSMLKFLGTQSIWTIDLVMLLQKIFSQSSFLSSPLFSPQSSSSEEEIINTTDLFLFCSTNLSVDQSYHDFIYYKKEFQNDVARVNQLFKKAKTLYVPTISFPPHGLRIECVIDIVSKLDCVAIALVDSFFLQMSHFVYDDEGEREEEVEEILESTSGEKSETKRQLDELIELDQGKHTVRTISKLYEAIDSPHVYAGHYIILCGTSSDPDHLAKAKKSFRKFCEECSTSTTSTNNDNAKQSSPLSLSPERLIVMDSHPYAKLPFCFVIKNPGYKPATQFLMPLHFEMAWRAEGTDQDIIFIRRPH